MLTRMPSLNDKIRREAEEKAAWAEKARKDKKSKKVVIKSKAKKKK